jgi:integrase
LRWRDVDLDRGTITVRAAKTDAGERIVNIVPALRDELADYRARPDPSPEAFVFATAAGRRQDDHSLRQRVFAKRLPQRLTPHSLRRTFASLLFAIGEPPPYVMAQMGHHSEPHAASTPDRWIAATASLSG